ncbi:2'-5' RNA ligase family protein [Alkaliphilus hydrothermalis]|uniref:2'-5' RNA ligase n=1 Tax=Alkaliphilus hydrothermalis TaxID=1482730 RepID=A0ABS2NMA9_9FIRM|nr:2'-5' RNA ligase family protein [Alkaliphilus hydrothermalis]MBM7614073.1 2'-5' RNA ligase [Alkaliphilus hydrothermalis]
MKERCIMIFPQFENMNIIDDIREKYDPLANNVRPHITLVFPFRSDIESCDLRDHLEKVLSSVHTFNLRLKDFTEVRSFGNYIFLNIEEGKEEIVNLHKMLYTGILESHMPMWLKPNSYLPHMTVGKIEGEDEYQIAAEETKAIKDVFSTIVRKVSVEIIDENQDSIIEMEIDLK